MERAFTPPLMANMGTGDWPDPHNISSPVMTSFHHQSWVAALEALSAHPIGGLCFSSFRYNSNSNVNYMLQQMLGVCGASLVSPGWLVLGIAVVMGNVQALKIRLYIFQVRPLILTQPFWLPAVSLCESCLYLTCKNDCDLCVTITLQACLRQVGESLVFSNMNSTLMTMLVLQAVAEVSMHAHDVLHDKHA